MELYKKRVDSIDELVNIIKALETLGKNYKIKKSVEDYKDQSIYGSRRITGTVWYIEEVEKEEVKVID